MKYGTSLRVRHIVGRFEKGEELLEAMRRLCARERIRAASFSAIGVLTAAELQRFDPPSREYVTCFQAEVALDILHLSGNISTLGQEVIVNVSAELAYTSYGQRHLVGGHLATGRVFACEFQLCSYDDLLLERTFDAATGLPLWNRIGGAALAELAGSEPLAAEPGRRGSEPRSASAAAAPAAAELDDDELPDEARAAAPRREPEIIRRRPEPSPPPVAAPKPTPGAAADVGLDDEADDAFDDDDDDALGGDEDEASAPAADTAAARPAPRGAWDAAIEQAQRNEARAQLQVPERARAPERPRRTEPPDSLDEDDDEIVVQKGDILLHPTLGECVVARVDDDESAYIKVGSRKPRKFALHMFDLEAAGEQSSGRKIYKLVKKRERKRGA